MHTILRGCGLAKGEEETPDAFWLARNGKARVTPVPRKNLRRLIIVGIQLIKGRDSLNLIRNAVGLESGWMKTCGYLNAFLKINY